MQSILNLKEKMETQAKNAFAAARAYRNEQEAKLEALEARRLEILAEGARARESALRPAELRENEMAIRYIKDAIKEQQRVLLAATAAEEKARQAWVDANVEKKTHQRLRDKAFEDFKQEIAKQEQTEVDELVSYTYGQKEQ